LIVGEGRETERNYFDGLKRESAVAAKFAVTVKKGPGFSAERVVQEAIKHKLRAECRGEQYDEVWCVLDVEGPSKRSSLDRAIETARRNGLSVCLSNPSFEVWLLSHFEKKGRPYNDCDAVIVQLNKHWRKRRKVRPKKHLRKHLEQDYQKNDPLIYERVRDRTKNAIANAQWVREKYHAPSSHTGDCNSSTEVYRLVRYLLG
jgi:hypothetical protein